MFSVGASSMKSPVRFGSFRRLRVPLWFGGPSNKEYSILGYPYFGKPPFEFEVITPSFNEGFGATAKGLGLT